MNSEIKNMLLMPTKGNVCGKKLVLLPGMKGWLASISTLCMCTFIEIIFTEQASKAFSVT